MSDEHIINFPRAVIYEAVFGNPKLSVAHKDGRTCIWFGGREQAAIVPEGTAVDIEIEPITWASSSGGIRLRLVRVSP